ncbi:MAG TPA: hypothetical protein VHQ87_05715, partial [Rhizobacter sp.]|nr:hypothetical protein [Rhizobacter sp.]
DERADIWAVCTVLYELIAGQAPFAGDNLQALFFGIACHPVPVLAEDVCDAELQLILNRGLAKLPEQRWSSARELGATLAQWLLAQGVAHDISGEAIEATWLRAGSCPALPSSGRGMVSSPDLHATVPDLQATLLAPAPVPVRSWIHRRPRTLATAVLSVAALAFYLMNGARSDAVAEAAPTEMAIVERAPAAEVADRQTSEVAAVAPAPEVKKAAPPKKSLKRVDPNWGF